MIDSLATLYNCFSELDTESKNASDGMIVHVETLLRAHTPKHLTATQLEMRDLLLDLLLVYANGRSIDKVGSGDSACKASEGKYCPAGFLLTHTAGSEFAKRICGASDGTTLDQQTERQLFHWLEASGITQAEWQMISPTFANIWSKQEELQQQPSQKNQGVAFAMTPEWMHDYVTLAFIGSRFLRSVGSEMGNLPSRGIALAQYLVGNGEHSSEQPKKEVISHFPELTFSNGI